MVKVFEIKDKSGRIIYLSHEQWLHIHKHPEMPSQLEKIKDTLEKPLKIIDVDNLVKYYYRYYKEVKSKAKYLRVIVKYLNGEGYIISAYFVEMIT